MRPGFRQWFAERVELLMLGVTLVIMAALVVWWTILLAGELRTNEMLERQALAARVLSPADRATEEQALVAHHDRRALMLAGESALLGLMLSGSLVVLFLLAQRRKQQREDMEKLLQFTSHEFKTPVAGVKGLLQSLAIGSIPAAQRDELLALGQIECDRLEHLAETILAYQRAMSRDPRAGLKPLEADRFIAELLTHRARTSSGGAVEAGAVDAVRVLADRDGLRVILENLLDNAHKYGGGGTVRLTAAAADGRWRLDISDHGRGFAPETAEKLFDLHNRGSGEGVTHGAGLGLAIARQLARRMGGDIRAHSAGPGHGAVFTVTLALAPPVPEAQTESVVHG